MYIMVMILAWFEDVIGNNIQFLVVLIDLKLKHKLGAVATHWQDTRMLKSRKLLMKILVLDGRTS